MIVNSNIYELLMIYLCNYLSLYGMFFVVEIMAEWMARKILHHREQNKLAAFLFMVLEKEVTQIDKESQY